jgi:hypothetical protein
MVGELEMEAVLQFDKKYEVWTAAPILGTVKYYDEDSKGV